MSNKNPFAILASDSDSEEDMAKQETPVAPPNSPPFRVWTQEEPFRGDRSVLFGRVAPKKKDEWVSIRRWDQPQFMEEDELQEPLTPTGESVIFPEEKKEFVLEDTVVPDAKQESMTAVAWAERIKKSLEKAETARAEKAKRLDPEEFKEALGRLSFFRRPMTTSS
jgi:hypothetical protein